MTMVKTITGPNETDIFTAHSYLEYLRKSASHWWQSTDSAEHCSWIFRGHADASWKLVPTAARPIGQLNEQIRNTIESIQCEAETHFKQWRLLSDVAKDQTVRTLSYVLNINQFSHLARDLGYAIRNVDLNAPLKQLLASNIQIDERGNLKPNTLDQLCWGAHQHTYMATDAVALAQHHGIPTFVLDWSESPVVAAFFAANEAGRLCDLAVWALDTSKFPPSSYGSATDPLSGQQYTGYAKLNILRPAKSENQYLHSQSGIISDFKDHIPAWTRNGCYPAIEDHLHRLTDNQLFFAFGTLDEKENREIAEIPKTVREIKLRMSGALKKIILPADQVNELQQLLYREGISKAHMMPTLDNVAATAMSTIRL